MSARRVTAVATTLLLLVLGPTLPASAAVLADTTPPQPLRPVLYGVYVLALSATAAVVAWAVLGGRRDAKRAEVPVKTEDES